MANTVFLHRHLLMVFLLFAGYPGFSNGINAGTGNKPGRPVATGASACFVVDALVTPVGCNGNEGAIQLQVTGGTAPYEYSLYGALWQRDPVFSNLSASVYFIRVRDASRCTVTKQVDVPFVNPLTLELGKDITLCEGKGITLPLTTNETAASFNWWPAAGLDNVQALQPKAMPVTTTKYYVTMTLGQCEKKDSVTVAVNPAPVANAGEDITICAGKSVQLHGSGGLTYQWLPATNLDDAAIGNPTVTSPSQSITYYLTVTDAHQCTSLSEDAITVTVLPPAEVFAGHDTSVVASQPLTLFAQDVNKSGFTHFTWSPATSLRDPDNQTTVATPANSITYKVVATTPEGCRGVGSIAIKVYKAADIYVPSAFSPNGDWRNETFKAIPVGISQFKYLMVFNRFGEQVFFTSRAEKGWDGLYHGLQQTGTFTWVAAGFDYMNHPVQRKGTVTVMR